MKSAILAILLTVLSGCYLSEDASDVNQERIKTSYSTVFNATRDYTKSVISFKFGYTSLRVSNPIYFRDMRLFEREDLILGLHYSRDVDGISNGLYEWTDEEGEVYLNTVKAFGFDLINEPTEFEKYRYYNLAWEGEEIPNQSGGFNIKIKSYVDGTSYSFHTGNSLELASNHLNNLPAGAARMTIFRNYSEQIDEETQAGGKSTVSFVREYEITIVE